MKKFISVLVLVCIMASFCTVSAFAETVEGFKDFKIETTELTDDGSEHIKFTVTANSDINNCVIELYSREGLISKTTPISSNLNPGEINCDIVLKGKASDEWSTTFYGATDYIYPWYIAITTNGNLLYRYFFTDGNKLTSDQKEAFNNLESTEFRLFTSVSNPAPRTGSVEAYTFDILTQDKIEDFKAVVYSGSKVLASTVPTDRLASNGIMPAYPNGVTVCMCLYGDEGGWWDTTIGNIVKGEYPDKLEIYSGSDCIYTSDVSWTEEQKATFDATVFASTLPFDLQRAVDSAEKNSSEPTVELPENVNVTVSEPVKVSKNVSIVLADNVFDNDITKTFDGSLFKLAPGATITISNVEGNETELELMRSLVSKDYCVSHGSIIVKDSHDLGSDGKCKVCGLQIVSNTYGVPSTADNSNMPLWTVLFIGFAAVVLLTGKKRRA